MRCVGGRENKFTRKFNLKFVDYNSPIKWSFRTFFYLSGAHLLFMLVSECKLGFPEEREKLKNFFVCFLARFYLFNFRSLLELIL